MRTIEITEPHDYDLTPNRKVNPCPIEVIQRALSFAPDVEDMRVYIYPDRPGLDNNWTLYFSGSNGFKYTMGAIVHEEVLPNGGHYSFHS